MRIKNLLLAIGIMSIAQMAHAELSAQTKQNHIIFASGGTVLDAAAMQQIEMLGQILNTPQMRDACIKLVGYSDQSGGAVVNQQISLQRANVVAAALGVHLVPTGRIAEIDGLGKLNYLPEISPTDPRQRRVAILARKCSAADLS